LERSKQSRGEDDKFEENDRLIAVSDESHHHSQLTTLKDLDPNLLDELEHAIHGKTFKPKGRRGVSSAEDLVEKCIRKFEK
jgi:inorganic pyrophosphatase